MAPTTSPTPPLDTRRTEHREFSDRNRPDPRLLRFILYARKSTDREDKQIQSIEDQTHLAVEKAKREGLNIVRVITESRSAKLAGKRPGFAEAIKLCEKGKADAILTWHPDRLARNAVDGGWIIDLLDRNKLKALSFASGYHFENSPEGKLMLNLIFSQAKYQVDKLSIDVSRGMASKRERGGFPHRAPEGYLNDRNTRTVVADPHRFPVLRRAVEMVLSASVTPSNALEMLNGELNYRIKPTKRNAGMGAAMPRATFYKILTNPFYAGLCRGPQGLYRGTHRPLLTVEEFRVIQGILGRTDPISQGFDREERGMPGSEAATIGPSPGLAVRPQKHDFAFTGIMRCGRCGCRITASLSKGNVYYHCTNMRRICDRKGVREEVLDSQIMGYLRRITVPDEFVPILDAAVETYQAEEREERSELAIVSRATGTKALGQVKDRIEKLLDMRLSGLLTDEEYLSRKASLAIEAEQLRQQIGQDEDSASEDERIRKTVGNLIRFCAWSPRYFAEMSEPQAKRQIVMLLAAEGTEPILTAGKLLLEPKPIFTRLSVSMREYGAFKPPKTGSSKSKETTRVRAVSSGGPEETMFKLCRELVEHVGVAGDAGEAALEEWLSNHGRVQCK